MTESSSPKPGAPRSGAVVLARRLLARLRGGDERTHYLRDYRRLVRRLMAEHPLDEAMSLAVGGHYEATGQLQVDLLVEAGLEAVLDLGCGSGRLSSALSGRLQVDYLGLDVIPELIAYARGRAPAHYRFLLNTGLSLPVEDANFDLGCAFSVFTHLHHEESFLYMREMARALRPGGRLVFSFLEFAEPIHWDTFENAAQSVLEVRRTHLDAFIERPVIALWAQRLGYEMERFTGPGEPGPAGGLGQSVAVLRRL
jgi:SAM-dependent methyltransferase